MNELRAILVKPDERHPDDIVRCVDGGEAMTRTAYDEAGDQPRIQWCVEHDCHVWRDIRGEDQHLPQGFAIAPHPGPCRVVSAIVVPLPHDAA